MKKIFVSVLLFSFMCTLPAIADDSEKKTEYLQDMRERTGASLVFFRNKTYLQYKKKYIYRNFDKSITPVRVLLFPVELPIALLHDLGEGMLVVGTIGLWEVFMGTDWWLTGKGTQGLP